MLEPSDGQLHAESRSVGQANCAVDDFQAFSQIALELFELGDFRGNEDAWSGADEVRLGGFD
jgi:hypothetical protein